MPGGLAARAVDVVAGFNGTPALRHSTFTVPGAVVTAVIGPNGSGKSTLLNLLTGLVRPSTGSVEVFGETPERARHRVGYVLQTNKVNEVMPVTVREVVSMGRYARLGMFGRFSAPDRTVVARAMERLGVDDLAARHLTELSGGQRQRVFVAQGLAQEADLLLLDEPITGLDVASRERIVTAIGEELSEERTVVFTTHDLAEAGEADHIILMAGEVVAEGPPERVLEPDLLARVFGVGILHLEDGSIVLDDGHHRSERHVHFERGS